jgi:hypothetical protein
MSHSFSRRNFLSAVAAVAGGMVSAKFFPIFGEESKVPKETTPWTFISKTSGPFLAPKAWST